MKPFAGIYTPIATPFRDDGAVDERALPPTSRDG